LNNQARIFILLLIASIVHGQDFWGGEFPDHQIEYDPETYICYKTDTPVVMDGKMDDSVWTFVDWTQYFVDIEGDVKPKPYHQTRVKMLWSEDYFYFGVEMIEPHLWATLTQRDAVIFKDNDFEIFLDPDGDTHNYYELEVNAFETAWDLLLLKPYHDAARVAVDSWDIPGLITKVHLDGSLNDPTDEDWGWSVEIAIPWKALEECAPNPLPLDGEKWKVNFSRVQWNLDIQGDQYVKKEGPEHNWVWSPQGLIYMHMPERWGQVQFTHTLAGQGSVVFKSDNSDRVKWALRQVYYQQGNYFVKQKKFTKSLKKLGLKKNPVKGSPWPPKIYLTPSGWEAVLEANGQKFFIRKDGKVWTE
jgi:hypothetical protein